MDSEFSKMCTEVAISLGGKAAPAARGAARGSCGNSPSHLAKMYSETRILQFLRYRLPTRGDSELHKLAARIRAQLVPAAAPQHENTVEAPQESEQTEEQARSLDSIELAEALTNQRVCLERLRATMDNIKVECDRLLAAEQSICRQLDWVRTAHARTEEQLTAVEPTIEARFAALEKRLHASAESNSASVTTAGASLMEIDQLLHPIAHVPDDLAAQLDANIDFIQRASKTERRHALLSHPWVRALVRGGLAVLFLLFSASPLLAMARASLTQARLLLAGGAMVLCLVLLAWGPPQPEL